MSSKERNKVTTIVNHPTEVSSKFLVSSSSRAPPDKTQIVKKENSKEKTHKTTDYNTSVSVTTTLPQKNFKAMNGDVHNACTEKVIPLVKVERDLDKTSTTASQTPLTVAVPIHSSVCTPCLASNLLSSDGSVTSSMSTSPLCSPATLFSLEPSRTSSQASSPDHHRVDFATMSCSPETNNRIRLLKLLELQRYETPFKDFNDEEVGVI